MSDQSLSERLREFQWKVRGFLQSGAKTVAGGFMLYTIASHNGCLDSYRIKEARGLQGEATKTVATVDETWKDDGVYTPTLDGYNPKVIREVRFDDGTETTLGYRTLAWQPFRKWLRGEEFDPQPGEKYEVTSNNMIVRKVK